MSEALWMRVCCPACGGQIDMVNSTANGTLSLAIVRCGPCAREYEVTARLSLHEKARR